MKRIILILIFNHTFLLSLWAQFDTTQIVVPNGTNMGFVFKLLSADINNDGLDDIIAARGVPNRLEVYYNQGNANFSPVHIIPYTGTRLRTFAIADIVGDLFPEIIYATEDSLFAYLPNNSGQFGQAHSMSDSVHVLFFSDIIADDFNNDNITDIILLEHIYPSIAMGLIGGGLSPLQIMIENTAFTEFYSIVSGHFNNDNFLDFAIGQGGFDIYLNNGNASFQKDTNYMGQLVFDFAAGDFDANGFTDLAYLTSNYLKGKIADSVGKLHTTFDFDPSTAHYTDLLTTDVNGDGAVDIVAIYDQQDRVVWFENDGKGVFSSEKIIDEGIGVFLSKITLGDVDDDGIKDIIWMSSQGLLAYNINLSSSVGIQQNKILLDNFLFPNPAENWIQFNEVYAGELCIYSLTGKQILKMQIHLGQKINIDLPNGIYSYKLMNEYGKLSTGIFSVAN